MEIDRCAPQRGTKGCDHMAVGLNNIAIARRESGRIYLTGTVSLVSSRQYCLSYGYEVPGKGGNVANSSYSYTFLTGRTTADLSRFGCYIPDHGDGRYRIYLDEVSGNCETKVGWVDAVSIDAKPSAPVMCKNYFFAADQDGAGLPFTMRFEIFESRTSGWVKMGEASVVPGEERFLFIKPGVTEKYVPRDQTGWTKPGDITVTGCGNNVRFVYTKKDEPYVPKPECEDGDKKPGKVCVNGFWEDAGCTEGTYTADRKMVCSGGVWVEVEEENGNGNGNGWVPGDSKYLTVAEADERVRTGLACYIKCVLPLLDLLPGLPYTPGAWVPPLCAITREA